MFDGSFKSSRKVNLSGRKKPTTGYSARLASLSGSKGGRHDVLAGSKEELMLQNRLAREERHAMKTRMTASIRIQAQYRRLRAAEQTRAEVFSQLEQQLTQTVLTGDIQNKALPTPQLQLFLRQFLFAVDSRVAVDRIRKVQNYLVCMLLVSSLKGENGTNFLEADKDACWVYQVTRMSEIALQTLVQEDLKKSVINPAPAVNPYLLLLDTLTNVSKYPTPEGQTALSSVLYHLGVTARYGIFDAISACIEQQANESVSRVENDNLMQVIANISAQTLMLSVQSQQERASKLKAARIWGSFGRPCSCRSCPNTQQDPMAPEEDYDMDHEADVPIVPPTYLSAGVFSSDEEVRRGVLALGEAEASVRAQWQKICHSSFSARCLDALLHANEPSHNGENAVPKFCHALTTVLLSTGRSYVLSVAASLLAPPSKLYSHMLLGLDDEAFYDGQWPLRLTEVEAVVTFLKQFIYDTCWTITSNNTLSVDSMDEKELVLFSAVVSSIKLFNQLYDRDCRRRFMPDGAWLWPSMPVVKEIVDLELMKEDGNHDAHAIYMLMNGKASSPYARAALILVTIPQVLSFNDRVQLFQKLLEDGKAQLGNIRDEFSRALQVRVKRDEIVDDSFDFFQKVCDTMSPAALKSRVKVTFVNEQGLEEAGIDGGGVFKEYMDSLTKSAFSPEYGFFLETEEHLLYPNPGVKYIVDTRKEALDRYRFLGRVLAKAVYENILVEPQFAAFFLNKLLGKFNYIDDLHSLDPELYTSLMRLKHYDGNVEDLALTFSVSEMEFGEVVTRNLVPDGANIPVTNENRIRYIHLMANYKLNVLSSTESAAFLKGFRDLIPGTWIQMFAPAELQMLIGGTATNIDIDDWERHTVYGGGYHPSQRIVQWFWEIVREDFTAEDRAALLKFITSCSRQPLLGFSKLQPQICIHQVRVEDDDRLPSSATCMNLLKLPAYSNREAMRKKLLYAIRSNAGFDLS
ncbi:E3 ubiquitin-protein ligase [Phytophthora cactorum]|nr:E3 ubiquitin-protein ligase [Phytophthora cactorum]